MKSVRGKVMQLATAMAVMLLHSLPAKAQEPDLVIEVGPDVFEHGGVFTVYAIPTDAETWKEIEASNPAKVVTLNERYGVVQFRHLEGHDYTYRIRPVEGVEQREKYVSQTLSVIGTDFEGRGPTMEEGFTGAITSGGRTIRSVPIAEVAADSDAGLANARWGVTQGVDAPPPADARSARALVGVIESHVHHFTLACEGDQRAQVCTIAPEQRAKVEPLWWRAIAEQRLERLTHYALRRCYDSSWLGGGTCSSDPDSDEPDFTYKP